MMNHIPHFYLSSKCRAIKHCYDQTTNQKINEPTTIQATYVKTPVYEPYHIAKKNINVQNDDYPFSKTKPGLKVPCYGNENLHVVSKRLKNVLVSSKFCIIPNVEAATCRSQPPPAKPPEKPPPMKYKDLSLYESPHYEYKDYIKDKERCSDYDTKLMHTNLYPRVKNNRRAISNLVSDCYTEVKGHVHYAVEKIQRKKDEFVAEARNPDNFLIRRGAVATSAVVGFLLGRRLGKFKDSVIKGLLLSGAGALATGALCFPDETDEYFRELCFKAASLGILFYNVYANDNKTLKRSLPCGGSLPSSPCMPEKKKEDVKRFRVE